MIEIVMPMLSETMGEGTVLRWLKRVGDRVALNEELVEIETDKTTVVYRSDAAGVLAEICVEEGEALPVGTVIARIEA